MLINVVQKVARKRGLKMSMELQAFKYCDIEISYCTLKIRSKRKKMKITNVFFGEIQILFPIFA